MATQHQPERHDITETADVWTSCPDCGKSLQFYSRQACDAHAMTYCRYRCSCGASWRLASVLEVTREEPTA